MSYTVLIGGVWGDMAPGDGDGYDLETRAGAARLLLNACEAATPARIKVEDPAGQDVTEDVAHAALAVWLARGDDWETLPAAIASICDLEVTRQREEERQYDAGIGR